MELAIHNSPAQEDTLVQHNSKYVKPVMKFSYLFTSGMSNSVKKIHALMVRRSLGEMTVHPDCKATLVTFTTPS